MGRSEKIGVLAALSAGIIWGFLGIFVREMTSAGFTPMQMTCLRYTVVSAALLIYIGARFRDKFRVDLRILVLLVAIGVLGNALNSTTYFSSMERISLSLSTILQYFAPFIVVVVSAPLFRERLTRTKILSVAIAFLGCVGCTGVLTDAGEIDTLGILFGCLSGIFYAFYTVGSKKAKNGGCSTLTILFYASVFCMLFLMPVCDFHSALELTFGSVHGFILVISLGLLMTLLPFGLYNYSLGKIEAGKAAIITYVEPLAATVVGLVFYSESVTLDMAVGMILILLALVLLNHKAVAESD